MNRSFTSNQNSFVEDEFVISGISGRFPMADNMTELKENLFNKVNCVSRAEDRWTTDAVGNPENYVAALKSLDKFDADFFNFNPIAANHEDCQNRMVMEVSYEAITDSGYTARELSGKHIGVFIGLSDTDPVALERKLIADLRSKSAVGYVACMIANKISYRYNITGPSFVVDAACSSSGTALEDAFRRLKAGTIEAAIVGTSSLCLDPRKNTSYSDKEMLSSTGQTSSYDAKANGFVRGDAVVVMFVQNKKDARRIYAKIHNIESMAGDYGPEGMMIPAMQPHLHLYRKTYEAVSIDPSVIDYIEGHGSSVPKSDETEVNSIDEVFCKDRKSPLLLGSLKSNIGHTEAASALCSIAKVILAFEEGAVAPNVNYSTPNPKCPSLAKGNIKIVTETTPYNNSLAAINNFGYGGALVHMILERNKIEKSPEDSRMMTADIVPKLVLYAATTETALTNLFNHFHENSMSREFFALLNNTAYIPTILAPNRGFTILKEGAAPVISIENSPPVKRQLWYVMTGMGCQWPGMGLDLMELKVFAESMRRSAKVLEPFNIDLLELLDPKKDYLQRDRNITPAFVTISAIQIALVDVLKSLDLEPDGIIGHSTGELACSYADGCCTAEQTILSAYYRGASVESTHLPRGAMAAVGLTWEEAKRRCPDGVYPACHNAEDSVTISGELEAVEEFVETLKSENIFARIVNAYGYAFHCETIKAVSGKLMSSLQKVYIEPRQRSNHWLSTSYTEDEWNSPECQIVDANYFCHNLESEVHFSEVLSHIPADAIIVEIGPHPLLHSILKRAIGNKASYIGLMKRNDNNVDFLLSSIGKLYNLGLDPQVENLYEPVSYPVPRGTPMISPLIQWDHSKSFHVSKYSPENVGKSTVHVKTSSTESFLLDHCIEGRSLYPATGYIYLVWITLCKNLKKPMEAFPIRLENFKIMRATIISSKNDKAFEVRILDKNGDFEILEGGSIVATGKILVPKNNICADTEYCYEHDKSSHVVTGTDMYNELKIHGYEYGPSFRGLMEINMEGTNGLVKWNDEWISFLDSLLLFFGIVYENSDFKLPTGALSIQIDPRILMKFVAGMEEKGLKGIPVKYDKLLQKCTTPGVEIRKLKLDPAPHRSLAEIVPVLEEYSFVPYHEKFALRKEQMAKCETYLQACCHLTIKIIDRLKITGKIRSALQDFKLNEEIKIEKQFASTDEGNYILLNTLQNVLEMSISPKTATKIEEMCCQNIRDVLYGDMLFKEILTEKPLRSLLDIALENCYGRMTVTEWSDNSEVLIMSVRNILKCCTEKKISYTLIHSHTTRVNSEDLYQKSNILVVPAGENDAIPENLNSSCHLGVTSFVLGSSDDLKSRIRKASTLVKEGGFLLFIHKHELTHPEMYLLIASKLPLEIHSETSIEKMFSEENLHIASKKGSSFGINAYLLRKVSPKLKSTQLHVVNVKDDEYESWVDNLKEAMVKVQDNNNSSMLYLVAQGTAVSGIVGMVNCLKEEPGGDKIRCVFTDNTAPGFDPKEKFYADILEKNLLMNIYMNGSWGSFRHTSLSGTTPMKYTGNAYVECTKLGDLSSFKWMETPVEKIQSKHGPDELYHIYYSALNFKDVMIATGRLTSGHYETSAHGTESSVFGMEFSGRDRYGRRIMAITGGGSMCNTLFGKLMSLADVPDHWSLEEAATVPVVYFTSYYALILRADLQQGEKILIHSGTGGIGQAAIRIALSMNCEIFTTVGTTEKRNALQKMFPQIKPENIGSSRDTTFEEMVMRQTKGEGVDVVLNSLAEDKLQASVRCLGYHGRFLEIGKYDLQMNSSLGLEVFQKGIGFFGVMLDSFFDLSDESQQAVRTLEKLLFDGIRRGVVQPLSTTVFPIDDVEQAFRYMASGKHMGKVLLKVRDEEDEKTVIPTPVKVNAIKTFCLSYKKSYIIIGGLGGFGIELTKWLLEKGAGTVVLTSRFGARTSYHHLCLKRWKESGARVVVSTLNVAKREEAEKLLQETTALYGPIGGIFNSAAVLKDAFIENQSALYFEEVCAPKALASKNLDELTRIMCPELNMFVCFSSISCGKGNAGQSNYGYANSVMERICEQRKRDGFHGLAIQWGIIGDVGLVHRHMGDDAMIAGVMAQKIKSCLHYLEKFLLEDKPVVSSFVTADKSKLKNKSGDVLGQMAKMLGIPDIDQMNQYRTFGEMGIDSMVGVEMKQLLESSFDQTFSLQQIQDMKVGDVKKLVAEQERNKGPLAAQEKQLVPISFNGPCILLPRDAVTKLNKIERGNPIFIINGNDLLNEKLQKLCERILRPVFAIQTTKDTPINSLKDMAIWYLKEIQEACLGKPIHLASVSSAANLSLEMVLQSEAQDTHMPCIKSLTIIDGSLDLLDALSSTEQEKEKNVVVYESSDLCEFLSAFSDSDLSQMKTQLELLPDLETKIKMISNALESSDKPTFSEAVEFYAKKQNLLRSNLTPGKIHRDIILIEAAEKLLPNDISTVKSSMAQVCDGRIDVHRITGNYEFLVGEPSASEVAELFNNLQES